MLNRRQFGIGLAAAGAVAALPRIASAKASELRILTWEGYAEPDWVKPFEAANGVKCQIVYIGSVDEMFAKMQGSKGADYDVVAFDTSSFARYIENKLIQPHRSGDHCRMSAISIRPSARSMCCRTATSAGASPSPGAPAADL